MSGPNSTHSHMDSTWNDQFAAKLDNPLRSDPPDMAARALYMLEERLTDISRPACRHPRTTAQRSPRGHDATLKLPPSCCRQYNNIVQHVSYTRIRYNSMMHGASTTCTCTCMHDTPCAAQGACVLRSCPQELPSGAARLTTPGDDQHECVCGAAVGGRYKS